MDKSRMTPEQFCYWLQGWIEIQGVDARYAPDQFQWHTIKDHLKLVFEKITPDRVPLSYGESVVCGDQSQPEEAKEPESVQEQDSKSTFDTIMESLDGEDLIDALNKKFNEIFKPEADKKPSKVDDILEKVRPRCCDKDKKFC